MSALAGRSIVVTRAASQAATLRDALAARGAEVVLFPTIVTQPARDPEPVRRAVASLEAYSWIVFTSANAVRFLADELTARPGGRLPPGVHVAAVGTGTAEALAERHIRVDAIPDEFLGSRIAAALGNLTGRRVLLPRADLGRPETPDALRAAGALVDDLTVYHTVPAAPDPEGLARLEAGVDAVTFTSPSTFTNFVALVGHRAGDLLAGAAVASIGPVTSAAIRHADYPVHVEPAEHTMAGLVDALDTFFASHATGVAGDTR